MIPAALSLLLAPLIRSINGMRNRRDAPVLVLIYHRVTTLARDPQLLAVTPDHFREQLSYLKENFAVGRLEDDWEALPKPGVVLTFDDGYADNALEALPILEELGVPATFFITPSLIGTRREFWWDELERVILGQWDFPSRFELPQQCGARRWPTASPSQRQRLYRELHPVLKKALPEEREECLRALQRWAGAGSECRATHRPLSHDELRRLALSPMATIGSHTMNHPALASLPVDRQMMEIAAATEWLERFLDRRVPLFSYPFGSRGDYAEATVRLCREGGFTRAASNFPGQWRRDTDPLQIPRNLVRDWGRADFEEKMRRFWTA